MRRGLALLPPGLLEMSARRSSLKASPKDIFHASDLDGDGFLSFEEFKQALSALHVAIPPEEAAELRKFLKEGEGSNEEIREIFEEINTSHSGKMTLVRKRSREACPACEPLAFRRDGLCSARRSSGRRASSSIRMIETVCLVALSLAG